MANTSLLGLNQNNMQSSAMGQGMDNSLLGLDGGNMMNGNMMNDRDFEMNNRSLLGLDGGNMMQAEATGIIDTSLMDLKAAMQSPKDGNENATAN